MHMAEEKYTENYVKVEICDISAKIGFCKTINKK